MSPAVPGNVELDQYIGSCLISQSSRNSAKSSGNQYQRQNTRQFHNSQNRNQYQAEQFGKVYNGTRQKHNTGFHRQTNFAEATNGWRNISNVSSAQVNQRRYQQYSVNNQYNSKARKEFAPNTELNRAPFSRLAMNNSNPPHIQNEAKFNSSRTNKSHFNRNNQKFYNKNSDPLESKQNQKDTTGRPSDALSNISDESSGHSENSLPRIIKPRKRRKKDRKPQIENSDSQVAPVVETQALPKPTSETPSPVKISSVVRLKTYTPLMYEQTKPIITIQPREESKPSVLSRTEEYSNKKMSSSFEEPIFSPLVTDSFVNLLLDEGKQIGNVTNSNLDSNPLDNLVLTKKDEEPSMVCQCRYCDPSGEIWDVEQRCYSPFLTPPAPNEPKLFINSIRSVISGNLNKSNAGSYLLRRSWSEPSETSFTAVRSRNKSDSYEPNANDLQVSSEIITSPNGHRDIEIKFFSTAKRYAELYKPTNLHVPYSQVYYPSPPVSPWKKEIRFGDAFAAEYSSVNVSV